MNLATEAGLFVAAVTGGALNALSGGGTFIVFPSLLLAGIPAVSANATNTVALWPGVVSSTFAYRAQLSAAPRRLSLAITSIIGGGAGALLLLKTPSHVFEGLVPFLMFFATVLFATGPTLSRKLRRPERVVSSRQASWQLVLLLSTQLVIALYGGYFGGGLGILMLAAFGLMGMTDFHATNALRTFLAACINGVAVIAFSIAGAVAWPEATLMLFGGIAGGYGGAKLVQRVKASVLRRVVIVVAAGMTAYFFFKTYG